MTNVSILWPTLQDVVILVISDDRSNELMLLDVLDGRGCKIRSPGPRLGIDTEGDYDVGIIAVDRLCGWTAGVITALRASRFPCAAVVLLNAGGPEDIAQSLRYGAFDCLVKPLMSTELLESLSHAIAHTYRWRERVAACRPLVPAPATAARLQQARRQVFEPVCPLAPITETAEQRVEDMVDRLGDENQLTPREREVLYWLIQGHRYDDIASVLGVAPRTAKFHAANLLRKLDLDSRHDLSRLVARDA